MWPNVKKRRSGELGRGETRRGEMGRRRSHLGGDALRGLDADAGVPFPRREDGHLIQELIDPRQQVRPVLRLVGDVVEDLADTERDVNECNILHVVNEDGRNLQTW